MSVAAREDLLRRYRSRERLKEHVAHGYGLRAVVHRLVSGPTDPDCRDTEWEHAWMMMLIAGVLTLPGDSFASPSYATFDRLGIGEIGWALIFGCVGVLRLSALQINGRRPQTPLFRKIGAACGFLMWLNLFLQTAIASWSNLHGVPPGVALFLVLTFSEFRSFLRAGYDVRYAR